MNNYQRILGERVKSERKKRGLTQVQLAELIHSNKRTIIDIENYRGNPKMETLVDLLTFLRIDPYIIFYSEPTLRSDALSQLELSLHDCSNEQIKMLVPIYRSIIDFADASRYIDAVKNG